MRALFPIFATSAALFGCGVEYPAPVVTGVSPERGWNGADTVVTISGNNFYPQVWVESGGSRRERIDDNFSAFLRHGETGEEVALSGSIVGYDEMEVVVKPGLPLGLYDVIVESPSGLRGELAAAYTVSDSVAARIELNPATETASVQTGIPVAVYLVDPAGERVEEAGLAVRFWLSDANGDRQENVTWSASGMFAVEQPTTPGGDLTAVLGTTSSLVVTVDEPGAYDLHAAPQRDTSIAQATEGLEWTQADIAPLEIDLPASPFVARAGEPFDIDLAWVNVLGDPAPDHEGTVVLRDACTNTLVYDATFTGSVTVPVTLNTPCASLTWIENTRDGGRSDDFQVIPGQPDRIAVLPPVGPVVAGVEFTRNVYVQDVAGNATDYPGGTIALSASTGGLVDASCDPVVGGILGEFECRATPTVASAGVTLAALGTPGDITGSSTSFEVEPNSGAITLLDVDTPASTVAGELLHVDVRPVDAWGNAVDSAIFDAGDWSVSDDLGEAACAWSEVLPDGRTRFACTPRTARPDATVSVTFLPQSVQGASGAVEVVNGPLDRVELTVTGSDPGNPSLLTAGQLFDVDLAAFDAFDNPAAVVVDPVLDLVDDDGSLAPATATLGPDGTAQLQATLEVAGTTAIHAEQGGLTLGSSATLTVVPASTSGLRVTVPDAPWAWVGLPEDVRVEAIDDYGNRTAWTGSADLLSLLTPTPPVVVAVTNGVGTAAFTWTAAAVDEQLEASAAGWLATSESIDVAEDCGPTGPQAVLDFAGFPEAVACVDPVSGMAPTSASLAGSVAGTGALVRYAASVGDEVVVDAQPALSISLPGTGVHPIRALVVDDLGCGAETEAFGYAGPPDGEVVGPIALAPVSSSLVAGLDSTQVDVLGATDCSRDVAVGATIRIWSSLGEVTGASPTGTGLSVSTDPNGDASFSLDATAVSTGGESTLHAWVESGAALGLELVDITGDDQRPTVWWQDPSGAAANPVGQIELVFGEPLLSGTVRVANFLLAGPGASVIDAVTLDPSGTLVTLTLDSPADPALGPWTLTATQEIRDVAGNRLSGDWSGAAADYLGSFGGAVGSVDAVSCVGATPVSGRFRPDGDDGAGEESDALAVDLSSASAPAWWELEVAAADGTVLRVDRLVPLGASDQVVWDGRDAGGRVVGNGDYEVRLTPVDGLGNRGPGCLVDAVVDNVLGGLP